MDLVVEINVLSLQCHVKTRHSTYKQKVSK